MSLIIIIILYNYCLYFVLDDGVYDENETDAQVAWLGNKIYITHYDMRGVRVFTDHPPFKELPERINIKKLFLPCGMVASTLSTSIFISDRFCIWKIQLPENKLSRVRVHSDIDHLSITPDNELLAVMNDTSLETSSFSLDIFSLEDLSRTKSISVSFQCEEITCAAQLPNKNIVISYAADFLGEIFEICILTADGDVIRKFDPNMFKSIQLWCPKYFTVDDVGRLFILDDNSGGLFLFNSQMTDFHLFNIELGKYCIPRIVYIKGKQQLLVCEDNFDESTELSISVFHLSPCYLIRAKNDESLLPARDEFRFVRKRKANKFSTWNFQRIGLKKKRR